jgi:hypothetical protein
MWTILSPDNLGLWASLSPRKLFLRPHYCNEGEGMNIETPIRFDELENLRWAVSQIRETLAEDSIDLDMDPQELHLDSLFLDVLVAALNHYATDPQNPVVRAAMAFADYGQECRLGQFASGGDPEGIVE